MLGAGQQLFAFGIHPSGEPLLWSTCPTSIRRDELPILTDQQVIDLLDFSADVIQSDIRSHRSYEPDEAINFGTPTGAEWPIGDLYAALAVIPNPGGDYNWWFRLTCAIHDACGGNAEGYVAWRDWSASGHHDSKYRRLWRSLADSPTYYSSGTLVYEARQNDPSWDRPSLGGFTPMTIFRKG